MLTVTLYTKQGCHLCEDVKAQLAALSFVYPHSLVEIDIYKAPDLLRAYHLIIPVVEIGEIRLQAPITQMQLTAALQKMSQQKP
ncbi:MAG: hypothetical protein Kow0080_10750 [Candidatus Promineifilaceae bacterium]